MPQPARRLRRGPPLGRSPRLVGSGSKSPRRGDVRRLLSQWLKRATETNQDGAACGLRCSRYSVACPDLTVDVRDVIADGDKVVVRAVWSGTNAVSQKKVEFHGFVQLGIVDGKFAERWATVTPIVEIPEGTNVGDGCHHRWCEQEGLADPDRIEIARRSSKSSPCMSEG